MLILVKLVENPLMDNKLQELTTLIYYGNEEHSIQQNTKFHTYSTNNITTQIHVTGWKTKYSETNYTVEYNERYGLLRVHGTLSSNSGHQQFSPNSVITGDLRPTTIASGISYDGQIVFYIREYDGMIMHRTVHNNTLTNQPVYTTIFWKHNLLSKPL